MILYEQRKRTIIFSIILLSTLNMLGLESILPVSFCGYSIRAYKQAIIQPTIIDTEGNTIITKLQNSCADALVHILCKILQPEKNNIKITGNIANMYNDFGMNNATAFVQLMSSLAKKNQHDSGKVLRFINKQRQIYESIEDKRTAFFKAFDDAVNVYDFLTEIQNKISNNSSITQQEYDSLLKCLHLINWKMQQSKVTIQKSFCNRLDEAVQIAGGYIKISKAPVALFGYLFLDQCKSNPFWPSNMVFRLSFLMITMTVIPLTFLTQHIVPQTKTSNLAVKNDGDCVCIEDMSEIISHTPYL
ncbi:MAG TPA: hypothetical protein VL201_01185 [Patescibacteria group bacterium]|jgi:hypothetical protein|nr:hypothetical protein [Patescibacteria group bacterium]